MGILNILFHKRKKKASPKEPNNISVSFGMENLQSTLPLPVKVEDFKAEHIKVLRRLDHHPVKESFSGIMTIEVDIPNFINILLNLDLIVIVTYPDSLHLLKNDTLKNILKEMGLKISGNKNELVQRILNNTNSDTIKHLDKYSDCYKVTEKGQKVISSFYERQENSSNFYRNNVINMIEAGDINQAYKAICKHNAEMPVPPGIGVDWNNLYKKGISSSHLELYGKQLSSSKNRHITACAIYSDISGEATHIPSVPDAENYDIAFQNKILQAKREQQSYQECGIEKYRFLATLDTRTCPICGELDGKIFPVSNMKTGVNCPPMHSGCRCTTVAVVSEEAFQRMQRRARDPVTGKTYLVPASMNYRKWIRSIKK